MGEKIRWGLEERHWKTVVHWMNTRRKQPSGFEKLGFLSIDWNGRHKLVVFWGCILFMTRSILERGARGSRKTTVLLFQDGFQSLFLLTLKNGFECEATLPSSQNDGLSFLYISFLSHSRFDPSSWSLFGFQEESEGTARW